MTILITVSGGFIRAGERPSFQNEYFVIHTTIVIQAIAVSK